jgi:putative SOS response-associated peptidase YedK
MCGRFTFARSARELAETFDVDAPADFEPRYNIAPGQEVVAIRTGGESPARRAEWRSWGWLPHWAKDPRDGPRPINARIESAARSKAFRGATASKRCVVPADGFFEWRRENDGVRQPFRVVSESQPVFGLAGLYEHWLGPEGAVVGSCVLLTTESVGPLRSLHRRMPVALRAEDVAEWLAGGREADAPLAAWGDRALGDWAMHPVDLRVNDVRNDDPRCIEAVRLAVNLELFAP